MSRITPLCSPEEGGCRVPGPGLVHTSASLQLFTGMLCVWRRAGLMLYSSVSPGKAPLSPRNVTVPGTANGEETGGRASPRDTVSPVFPQSIWACSAVGLMEPM